MRRVLKILAVQAAIGAIALEIGLRLYNPIPFRVRGGRIRLPVREVYEFDNHAARKLDPVTRHTKNSLGFRGPEPPRDFADRLTILTIGGSTTECLFLSDGKTWTDVAARRLAARIPRVWMNNAGLDGQSTFGHIVLLRDVVAAMKPKIAVFLVGANDVALDRATTYDAAMEARAGPAASAVRFAADHLESVALAQNLVRAARARRRGFGHSEIDLRSAARLHIDAPVIDQEVERVRPMTRAYAERLHTIAALCRANGIEAVFATQPALFGPGLDPETGVDLAEVKVNGRGNGDLEWRLLELYNDTTRRVAGGEGAFVIDLARRLPKSSRLFYDFLHYTNEGAEAVGTLVGDALASHLRQ